MERREEYMVSGSLLVGRHNAQCATPQAVADFARARTKRIPAQFFVGTAEHESNFAANEVDTEPSGYVSKGIFQLADDEANQVGLFGYNLLNLASACDVFVKLQERRLAMLMAAVTASGHSWSYVDIWAYLAIAHNEGVQAALNTIHAHGVDWPAYKSRNAGLQGGAYIARIGQYGDDVISGGSRWKEVV